MHSLYKFLWADTTWPIYLTTFITMMTPVSFTIIIIIVPSQSGCFLLKHMFLECCPIQFFWSNHFWPSTLFIFWTWQYVIEKCIFFCFWSLLKFTKVFKSILFKTYKSSILCSACQYKKCVDITFRWSVWSLSYNIMEKDVCCYFR